MYDVSLHSSQSHHRMDEDKVRENILQKQIVYATFFSD